MEFILGSVSMLLLDAFYLSFVKNDWANMVKLIQGKNISVRIGSAAFVYIMMSFALYYFIIKPKRSVYDAALLGLVIYGVFDLTNYAIFEKYSPKLMILDMIWGAILFATSTFIVQSLVK